MLWHPPTSKCILNFLLVEKLTGFILRDVENTDRLPIAEERDANVTSVSARLSVAKTVGVDAAGDIIFDPFNGGEILDWHGVEKRVHEIQPLAQFQVNWLHAVGTMAASDFCAR